MYKKTISGPVTPNHQLTLNVSLLRIGTIALTTVLLATAAWAQTLASIYDFGTNSGDPINPQYVGVIAQGRDGNMYSTTPKGGTGNGAAFKITTAGVFTVIHQFSSTEGTPYSGLTLGTDGNFYGTTISGGTSTNCSGGCGTVFKMTPQGVLTVLYNFTGGNDGKSPVAPPIQASDGSFWGNTSGGGASGYGTIYTLVSTNLTPCVQFSGTDGRNPYGPLIQATDGSFWGTSQSSTNLNGPFVVYQVKKSCSSIAYWPYPSAYDYSDSGLVQGTDGNFYGTTYNSYDASGFVFKITPQGTFTDLHDFSGSDGGNSYGGLLLATNGAFFGANLSGGSNQFGTIYEITTAGKFSVVANFTATNGSYPSVTLLQNTNGTIYGVANQGGKITNTGTFFKLTGLAFEKPFVSLVSNSGKVGSTVQILGQGLKGTTAVSFNGTLATTFTVVSNTFITAVVPTGATSGLVKVTTPSGTLQSNRRFNVQ